MVSKIIRNVYKSIRILKKNILCRIRLGYLRQQATFIGEGQSCSETASIALNQSSKKNVIIEGHCDVYGTIISFRTGKVIMREWSKIGPGTVINCVNRVEIGRDTAIANNVLIIDNNTHPLNPADRRFMRHSPHGSDERQPWHSANAPIIIGENVWIGSNARICKGVTIGDNSIIAANSVLTKNVPANAVAAGNPARVVKEHIDKETSPIFL